MGGFSVLGRLTEHVAGTITIYAFGIGRKAILSITAAPENRSITKIKKRHTSILIQGNKMSVTVELIYIWNGLHCRCNEIPFSRSLNFSSLPMIWPKGQFRKICFTRAAKHCDLIKNLIYRFRQA